MAITYKSDRVNSKKIFVITDSVSCIEEVHKAAENGIADKITSKSTINGGVLIHLLYLTDEEVSAIAEKIDEAAQAKDMKAETRVLNSKPPPLPA